MEDYFEYKGFVGSIDYCDFDNTYFGKIMFIDDFVTYSGWNICDLEQGFRYSVNDYIEAKNILDNNQTSD